MRAIPGRARVWIAATLAAVTLLAIVEAREPVPIAGMRIDAAAERQIAAWANQERATRGLPRLRHDAELVETSRRWAFLLAEKGTIKHDPNLYRLTSRWSPWGENVGMHPQLRPVHLGFMASAGHRANILDRDYTVIGVGIVWESDHERFYIVERFGRPVPKPAPTPSPSCTCPR